MACRSGRTVRGTSSNHEGHPRGHRASGDGVGGVFSHRTRTRARPTPRHGGKVTADGMYTHLRKLQEIADANGGNRAEGTPGYDASVDYVVKVLKDKGFDVQTPEFERLERTEGGNPTLTVSGRGYPVDQASLLVTDPADRTQRDHPARRRRRRVAPPPTMARSR